MLVVGATWGTGGMPPSAWRTAALGLWMAIWWMTEAVPIAATALLPLVMLPLLGVLNINAAASPYANPVIFLFFGGFILATAFERSGLHRRLALSLVSAAGTRPDRIIGGFMIAGGFMSMWVSNTATVIMLLPLVNSMIVGTRTGTDESGNRATDFEKALLLGIAYAATIGGYGTLVGTPPNALLAGFLTQTHGIRVGFLDYMLLGVPIVLIGLPLTWLMLTRIAFRVRPDDVIVSAEAIAEQRKALGPMPRDQKFVALVGALTACAWISQPWLEPFVPGLSEAGISMACAVVLLAWPVDRTWRRVIDWNDAER